MVVSADCLSWVEHFGRAVLAGRWASAVGPLPQQPGTYPLAASLAWRSELLAVRGRVLLDAGADEVGEATAATGGGKTTRLVLHSRNRRLDPFRGVRVGEAANPGPETKGKGKGKLPGEPPELPDHYRTLGVRPTATPEEVKKAYRTLGLQHLGV